MSIISPIVYGIKYNIYNKNDCIQKELLSGSQWNEATFNIIKSYTYIRH